MKLTEVFEFLEKAEVICMATVEKDQPRVRTMALISYNNNLWCCTMASRPKNEPNKEK